MNNKEFKKFLREENEENNETMDSLAEARKEMI